MSSSAITPAPLTHRVPVALPMERASSTRACSNCQRRPDLPAGCASTSQGAWTSASTVPQSSSTLRQSGTATCALKTPKRLCASTSSAGARLSTCASPTNASTQKPVLIAADVQARAQESAAARASALNSSGGFGSDRVNDRDLRLALVFLRIVGDRHHHGILR